MPKANIKSKKGFTIIEVVLVLAIAGLIFLMVFIALPALQRSQRDTQRTDDMARVQSALMSWQNNHTNKLPSPPNSSDPSVAFPTDENMLTEDGQFNCGDNTACIFVRDYMNAASSDTGGNTTNTFQDPSGEFYNVVVTKNVSSKNTTLGTVTHPNPYTDGTMSLNEDLTNGTYTLNTSGENSDFTAYTMFIIPGATCEEDHAVRSTKNNFAVLYRMEGSGIKCTNNGS